MAEFAGYDMPISYDQKSGGMLKEHLLVRKEVGMFDVSHMGEFWIRGPQATAFLDFVCTRTIGGVAPMKAQYSMLLYENGTIVDDIIVYKFDDQNYWMVVNASNVEKDFAHLQSHAKKFQVTLTDVSDETALIAVQGPRAVQIIEELFPNASQLKYYSFFEPKAGWIIGRTGYTGEDGFEIFLPTAAAADLWARLDSKGVLPIGLGARDTLRLEVGFPLYGHELSDQLRPMETFAAFACDLKSNFLGSTQARETPRFIPIAVRTENPKPIRADDLLVLDGTTVGKITSGSTSPMLKYGIGLGLLEAAKLPLANSKAGTFMLESAGKQRQSFSQDLPFVVTARAKPRKKV